MWSLADTLDRLLPWLTAPLGDEAARARLRAAGRTLPAALSRYVYLESWLTAAPPRLDLIVKLEEPGLEMLAGAAAPLDPGLLASPAWRGVIAFARAWRDGLREEVESLWLEFDLDPGGEGGLPAPRSFVDFRRQAYGKPSVEQRIQLARRVLRSLGGDGDAVREPLARCFEALPSGAVVPYLGLDTRHPEPVVRVCALALGQGLARYLEGAGWEGDAGDLSRTLLTPVAAAKRLTPFESVSVLHLDLGPGVRPRIGLEFAFRREGQHRGELRERAVLDVLVERGWCRPERREALARWPGHFVALFGHEVWASDVRRRLAHVKVAYASGEAVAAKAYLCFSCDPLRGGTLVGFPPRFVAPPPASGSGALALSDGSRPRSGEEGQVRPHRQSD